MLWIIWIDDGMIWIICYGSLWTKNISHVSIVYASALLMRSCQHRMTLSLWHAIRTSQLTLYISLLQINLILRVDGKTLGMCFDNRFIRVCQNMNKYSSEFVHFIERYVFFENIPINGK